MKTPIFPPSSRSAELRRASKKLFGQKVLLIILVCLLIFNVLAVPKAQAQLIVHDPLKFFQDRWKDIKDFYEKSLKKYIATAFKAALKQYLQQVAYKLALDIAGGSRGQKPMYYVQPWDKFLANVGDQALGQFMTELSKSWGARFNICEPPSIQIKMQIHMALFKEQKPGDLSKQGICKWSDIRKNWKKWTYDVQKQPSKLFGDLRESLKPEESDAGIYLTLHSTLLSKKQEAALNAQLERGQSGIKDVTSKITKRIKTPSSFLDSTIKSTTDVAAKERLVYTGELIDAFFGTFSNTLMARWQQQLFQKGFDVADQASSIAALNLPQQGAMAQAAAEQFASLATVEFSSGQQNVIDLLSLPSSNPLPNSLPGPTSAVIDENFLTAIKAKMTLKEAMDASPKLIDGSKPFGFLPTNNKTTEPDYLSGYPYRSLVILRTHRIIPVGWELAAMYYKLYGETVNMNLNYLVGCFEDLDDRNNPQKPSGCREDTNGNTISPEDEDNMSPSLPPEERDFNPYYHLVDPNWVLKSPQTQCNRQGPGPEIIFDELQCLEDNVASTKTIINGITSSEFAAGPYCEADSPTNPTNSPDIPVRMVQRNGDYCGDWQSCLLEDNSGACQVYGYCVKEKPIWRFVGEECPAYYNSCETFTLAGGEQYSYLRDTLKTCYQNEAGCLWYSTGSLATTTGDLVWSTDLTERVYLNNQAEICQASNAGCSKLASLEKGVNLVANGSFEEVDEATSTPNLPADWEIITNLDETANGIEAISATTTGTFTGLRSLLMFVENFTGPTNGYITATTKGYIPIDPNFTYQATIDFKSTTSAIKQTQIAVYFYERQDGLGLSDEGTENEIYNDEVSGSTWQNKTKIFVPDSLIITTGEIPSTTIPSWAHYAKFKITGPMQEGGGVAGVIFYDNAQLTIISSPIVKDNQLAFTFDPESYYQDYLQNGAYTEYLKVPPQHLNCEAYNTFLYGADFDTQAECLAQEKLWRTDLDVDVCVAGGNTLCAAYANICSAEEVGCLGYTPIRGGPEVPAKIVEADVCPQECNGYDSYLQLVNYFEEIENPGVEEVYQYFIPPSAQVCPAQAAGCEQFTNLDEVAKGGEGLEYFTYLRQCISAQNPNIASYYTWEGSDTTGYQLKKWSLLRSDLESDLTIDPPCTNITIGQEDCIDSTATPHTCTYPSLDLNCRDFFNAAGTHFWLDQQYVVTASGECHPYRRTITGQIYNADPTEGVTCSPASNNCREYKGNIGNNIREVIHLDFSNGTFGSVTNSLGGTSGLSPSNEAVYQNDYSLRVFANDHIIKYPLTGELTAGKQYQLSFWAKKGDMTLITPVAPETGFGLNPFKFRLAKLLGKKAQAQADPTLPALDFIQSYLTESWQVYTLGPFPAPDTISNTAFLKLTINNLSSSEGFYIDNIILQEYSQNFYAVKDSWQTPASCDQPYLGAQLGCLSYKDTENATQYLKSFDYICQALSIGCRAYVTSQNSLLQASEDYFGTCDDYVGEIQESACANTSLPPLPTPANSKCCTIRGLEKCNVDVDAGEESCQYENITVPNDAVVYLVDDLEKTCNATQVGCEMVGKPTLNRQNDIYTGGDFEAYLNDYIEDFDTIFLINNPDQYNSQLCSESGLFCTAFNGDPDLTSLGYYFDPLAMGAATTTQAGEVPLGRTCYYDVQAANWKKSGTNEICVNNQFMPAVGEENYSGWVGLCTSQNSTCTEYRDPEQPIFEKAEECDALVSPQMSGLCSGNAEQNEAYVYVSANDQWYCQKTINGVAHKVCQLRIPGNTPQSPPVLCNSGNGGTDGENCTPCSYTENDWTCTLSANAPSPDGADCYIPDSTTGKKVCYVQPGQSSCTYSLACESYYYKHNVESCTNGIIDRNAGCLLFNDTSQATTTLSSDLTSNGQAPQTPSSCSNLFYENNDCDSNTQSGIKVEKDRVCAENLFCASSLQVSQEGEGTINVCLDIARCKKLNPANPSSCLEFVVNPIPLEQTYAFLDASGEPGGIETIRNLSGFSKAGLVWHDDTNNTKDKIISGYFEPQDMSQIGENVVVTNGDMEAFTGDDVDGWTEVSQDDQVGNTNNCSVAKSNTNPHGGTYSLKLNANYLYPDNSSYYCSASTIYPDNLYDVNHDKNYLISLYARSQNQSQRLRATISFYKLENDNYVYIDGQNKTVIDVFPTTNWLRYTGLFGPGTNSLIPQDADKFLIMLVTAQSAGQTSAESAGSLWVDDVQVETALEVGEGQFAAKECRLYPKDSAPACEYTADQKVYRGWTGYCLEFDPNGSGACLAWYPVDGIAGESLTALGQEATGYDGPMPLYYCLQSEGNYKISLDSINGKSYCPQCTIPLSPSYCDETDVLYSYGYNKYKWSTTPNYGWCGEGYHSVIQTSLFRFSFSSSPNELWNLDKSEIEKIDVDTLYNGSDAQMPDVSSIYNVYPLGTYTASENSYYFAWCNNQQMNVWNGSCDSGVKVGVKIFFENNKINKIDWYVNDNDEVNEDRWIFRLNFYLRESCPYIAQVVTSAPAGEEKVWYSHYNNSWPYNVSNLNVSGLNSGNQMGYIKSLDFDPYGAAAPGNLNDLPDAWTGLQAPLNIYQESPPEPTDIDVYSSGGLPISVPAGRESPGRMCLGGSPDLEGQTCQASYIDDGNTVDCYDNEGDNSGQGGICMGVGGFCYNGTWNSTQNSWVCVGGDNVGDACTGSVTVPPECPGGYCAVGVTNGDRCDEANPICPEAYSNCLKPNLAVALPDALTRLQTLFAQVYGVWQWNGISYQPYTTGLDFSIIDDYYTANPGIKPQVGDIKVNGNISGVTLTAPGQMVELSFTTDVNDNLLPIEHVKIKWYDTGETGPSANPNVDVESFDSPMMDQPNPASPHRISHLYTCIPNSEGDRCVSCWNHELNGGLGDWEDADDGACTYPGPSISVQDHWGLCSVNGWVSEDYPCDPVTDGVQYSGDIIIEPASQ